MSRATDDLGCPSYSKIQDLLKAKREKGREVQRQLKKSRKEISKLHRKKEHLINEERLLAIEVRDLRVLRDVILARKEVDIVKMSAETLIPKDVINFVLQDVDISLTPKTESLEEAISRYNSARTKQEKEYAILQIARFYLV